MQRVLLVTAVAVGLAAPAGADVSPKLPDTSALEALVDRAATNCNAADSFLAAEKAYRDSGELKKPREERRPLPPDHRAMRLVLEGLACRRCEFPYSADLVIPPLEQPIPMSALYWAASGGLVQRAQTLREQGKHDEADRELKRTLRLGLLLLEDPGMSFIQQLIALRVLAQAAEALGDRAIAIGEPERAAACARFLAQHNAYRDDMRRLLTRVVAAQPLLDDPARAAEQVKMAGPIFDATSNKAVQLEVLIYLGLARALLSEPGAQQDAERTLKQAERSPDVRIRKLARWALDLRADEARQIVRDAVNWPKP